MAYQFTLPRSIFIGKNALEASEDAVKALGKKAFVVTGRIVTKAGIVATLTGYLENWGIEYVVFNDITGEPTDFMVEAGVKAYKQTGCDFLIAIGGGSPLDSGKAIAAMTVLEGKISDYLGKEISGKFPPMVLIPTTAGTGSEATKFTVVTDSVKEIKMLLKGNSLLPELAIIDPSFTLTSPPGITAATGMDALTHAVEAYTSRKGTPLTEAYALSAVKRIFRYLPTAYSNGSDEKAREEMQLAAFEAGVSINNASVTLVHGMSRPIGALFHVPHGISNAMLIKECLTFALDGCYERFGTLGRIIGAATEEEDDKTAAWSFIAELEKLCRHCNIPTLEEYGINRQEFENAIEKMSEDALASGSPANTIKEVSKADVLKIYKKLWE